MSASNRTAKAKKIDAWWFAASDYLPHGDNRPIKIGGTHSVQGEIVLCKSALHASRDPFDALQYARGPYLYQVRCWGDVVEDRDKLGARHRMYLAKRDATNMLRLFAREQALSVIHFWDAPEVVRQYLETGDETLRTAARDAPLAAARTAARAAEDAARTVAWAAAGAVAVWAAADAARDAALAAAEAATEAAAWAAAGAAARTAEDAAWAAAGAAARAAARKRFNELVDELFAGGAQ